MEEVLQYLVGQHGGTVLAVLFTAAAVEYIFPPFPGDTVTLAGTVLVAAYDWNLAAVFAAVTAGSLLGAMLDFHLGRWWRTRPRRAGTRARWTRKKIDRLVEKFHQHGEAYLVVNRFLPGIRALFFVAAGMAGMRPIRVALFATISAALWNALIIATGFAVGRNIGQLETLFRQYTTLVWGLIALAGVAILLRWLWKKRKVP